MNELLEEVRGPLAGCRADKEVWDEIKRLEARCLKLYNANEKQTEYIAELKVEIDRLRDVCTDRLQLIRKLSDSKAKLAAARSV